MFSVVRREIDNAVQFNPVAGVGQAGTVAKIDVGEQFRIDAEHASSGQGFESNSSS